MDAHSDPNGTRYLRTESGELVVCVAATPSGPRVALGGHSSNRDVVILSLAAIAQQVAQRHGMDAAELLRMARDVGLPSIVNVSAGGIILPAGLRQ